MPAVQTTYTERIEQWRLGQVANLQTCDVDTYVNGSTSVAIPFGRIVRDGANEGECLLGIKRTGADNPGTAPTTGEFLGVAVKDPTRRPDEASGSDQSGSQYGTKGAHVAVLWRGDVIVQVKETVAVGDPVWCDEGTGEFYKTGQERAPKDLGDAATRNGRYSVAGARYMQAGSANALVRVRFAGPQPLTQP